MFQCQDQKGIVAAVSDFVLSHSGNILNADQHTTDPYGGQFFLRVEFCLEDGSVDWQGLQEEFLPIAKRLNATFRFYDQTERLKMGIFVSRPDHCLFDLLYLWGAGELQVDIPFVVSNFSAHKGLVERFGVPFYFIAATKDDRKEEELLFFAKKADFLVLARYMLVLSPGFLASFGKDIINIHHGFLPAFKGVNPYRQALQQGVKVIGATAHFVNEQLDAGPIIAQSVEYVSHKDSLQSLIRKGKNLEKRALVGAVSAYIEHRVIRWGNKTVVFR